MKVAVIGLGYWGPNLARNLYETHLCEEIYCCDLDETKLNKIKSRYPSFKVEKDFKKLLKNDDIDAAIIATPVICTKNLKNGGSLLTSTPITCLAPFLARMLEP